MSLSWHARRRWSLLVLLVGLPIYIGLALWVVSLFDRPSVWLEFLIYFVLGIAWALPLRAVFLSVARSETEADDRGAPTSGE